MYIRLTSQVEKFSRVENILLKLNQIKLEKKEMTKKAEIIKIKNLADVETNWLREDLSDESKDKIMMFERARTDAHKFRGKVTSETELFCIKEGCSEFTETKSNYCLFHGSADSIPYLKAGSDKKPEKIGNIRI